MFEKIVARVTRMAKMDNTVYDEIAVDEQATQEAAIIVGIVAVITALFALITGGFGSFIWALISTVAISWLLWSAIVWFVGTKLFAGTGTFWNVARGLGYAAVPGILGIIPVFGSFIGGILSLVLGFFAIREIMDMTTEKTVFTIVIGWVISFVISFFVAAIF